MIHNIKHSLSAFKRFKRQASGEWAVTFTEFIDFCDRENLDPRIVRTMQLATEGDVTPDSLRITEDSKTQGGWNRTPIRINGSVYSSVLQYCKLSGESQHYVRKKLNDPDNQNYTKEQ